MPIFADLLTRSLEDHYLYRSIADCPESDAVFVFGGMLGPRDRVDGSVAWNQAAERFDRAVGIIKAGKAHTLVLSGGPERYPEGPDEGEFLRGEAIARGIAQDRVLVTRSTANTEEEASAMCQLVALRHWERVLIVTSAFHMVRAMNLSRKCSAARVPVPVAYQTPSPGTSWAQGRVEYYIPQAEALAVSERALREYLGIFVYSIFH